MKTTYIRITWALAYTLVLALGAAEKLRAMEEREEGIRKLTPEQIEKINQRARQIREREAEGGGEKTEETKLLLKALQADPIDYAAVKENLFGGANPNTLTLLPDKAYTPLTYAVLKNDLKTAELLLLFGADINTIGSPFARSDFLWEYLLTNPPAITLRWLIEHGALIRRENKEPLSKWNGLLYALTFLSWQWSSQHTPKELKALFLKHLTGCIESFSGCEPSLATKQLSTAYSKTETKSKITESDFDNPTTKVIDLLKSFKWKELTDQEKAFINDLFIIAAVTDFATLREILFDFNTIITNRSLDVALRSVAQGGSLPEAILDIKHYADRRLHPSQKAASYGQAFALLAAAHRPRPALQEIMEGLMLNIDPHWIEQGLHEATRQGNLENARFILDTVASGISAGKELRLDPATWKSALTTTAMLAILVGSQDNLAFFDHILQTAEERKWDINFEELTEYINALSKQNKTKFGALTDQALKIIAKYTSRGYLAMRFDQLLTSVQHGVITPLLATIVPLLTTIESYRAHPHG
jgi:hypothetical protein